ncbi:hypothetical protein [Streptomyces radicis]|uniref:hypothetical protein n=1 Tax=Streptomyces radicis TaxID=1750517 RepID=UPI0011C36844|nr:hypothetical protein [Streptomyces radicis]
MLTDPCHESSGAAPHETLGIGRTNVVAPQDGVADVGNTPTSKGVVIRLERRTVRVPAFTRSGEPSVASAPACPPAWFHRADGQVKLGEGEA